MNDNYNIIEKNTNNKENRTIKLLIIVLFILCFSIIGFIIYDKLPHKNNNTPTKNPDLKENNTNIELEKTKTVTNAKDGTYIIDVSNVVDNVMPSIVAITSKTKLKTGNYGLNDNYTTGAGSGIIINETEKELMILTNYHVIEDADILSVRFINNQSVDATVLGKSKARDIAVITVQIKDLDKNTLDCIKIATLGDSKNLKVGQGIIAIGNALGYGQSVTTGVISALNREINVDDYTSNMIQIDAAINGGNSGGALINSRGEVVGINSAKYSSKQTSSTSIEGMGFAIPISDVSDLINKIINDETLNDEERGYLGISGYMITDEYSKSYDIPKGIYIKAIIRGSGAEKANLHIGNIITEIDGIKVNNFTIFNVELESKRASEKVKLKVQYIEGKEYKEKEVEVTLSSYKEINS